MSNAGWTSRRYWIVTGLFCTVFVVSALLTIFDPDGTRRQLELLGFPTYIGAYPLAVAKLLGVGVILWRGNQVLVLFAFAGFLYDLLLALTAHVREGDFPAGWLAVAGLVLWVAAFAAERDRTAREAGVRLA